jgi:hypothetical protein
MGLFLPYRKLISAAYLPTRWERDKIKDWVIYCLTVPDAFPGMITLAGQATQQVTATVPVYFALCGFVTFASQPEGWTAELFHNDTQQALINPFGPPLNQNLLGGSGRRPFFLKEFFFMDPGDTLTATVANQSENPQLCQLVGIGFQPLQLGVEMKVKPEGPTPGRPFFVNDALKRYS